MVQGSVVCRDKLQNGRTGRADVIVVADPDIDIAAAGRVVAVVLDDGAQTLGLGARVLHPQFGEGVVKSLDGSPDNIRATVFFRRGGEKRLYVRFANLEILGGGH